MFFGAKHDVDYVVVFLVISLHLLAGSICQLAYAKAVDDRLVFYEIVVPISQVFVASVPRAISEGETHHRVQPTGATSLTAAP